MSRPPTSHRTHVTGVRTHRTAARLSGTPSEVGWVTEVIVNRATGRVVDGHLPIELPLARAEPIVPVTYIDLYEIRLARATREGR
jgi:hypothetical protein